MIGTKELIRLKKLGEVLREGRKRNGLSASEAVEALAALSKEGQTISAKTLYGYENNTREPDTATFLLLCGLYGIADILNEFGVEYEGQGDSRSVILSAEEYARVQKFRALDSHGRMIVDALLSAEASRVNVRVPKFFQKTYTPPKKNLSQNLLRKLPLYYSAASAGTGASLGDGDYETVDVSDDVPQTATFGVRISGDSMEPKIMDGATVWVREQPDVEFGEVCIAVINGEGYCKVKTPQGLKSLNPKYKLIQIHEYDNCSVRGKVVYIENPD